jgi:hypothetical protein
MKINFVTRRFDIYFLFFLILFSIGFAWTNSKYIGDNASSRMALVERLLGKGVFYTEGSPYFSRVDGAFYKGHYYTGKQPFLSMYTAAILYPVHFFIKFRSEIEARILYVLAVMFTGGLAAILLFVLLKKSLSLIDAGQGITQWIVCFVFLASGILPYSGLFVSHMVEATLIFACFYFLLCYRKQKSRWASILCGLCVGFSSLFHILIGTLFIGLTGLYFLTENVKDFLKYTICVLAIVCLGLGINYLEHQSVVPFDFMLDSYLFRDGVWLNYPHNHRITDDQIRKRLNEIGVSLIQREKTVIIYTNYRNRVGNMWQYAIRRFWIADYLTLNPLFFIGLLSLILLIFQKNFYWKKEAVWVGVGMLLTYISLLYLRANPGTFNGNRYLVPISPLVIFFISFMFLKQKYIFSFAKLVFWIVLPMFLPFFISTTKLFPSIYYIYVNLTVFIFLYILCFLLFLSQENTKNAVEKLASTLFGSSKWMGVILLVLWTLFQLQLYKII